MLIAIFIQSLFNVTNAYLDAYRILKNKNIAHWLNFGLYFILVCVEIWLFHYSLWQSILLLFIALFNRQITFDIPLNIRRGLSDSTITWDYVSRAEVPAAWFDRLEIKIFGRNGKKMVAWYAVILVGLITLSFL